MVVRSPERGLEQPMHLLRGAVQRLCKRLGSVPEGHRLVVGSPDFQEASLVDAARLRAILVAKVDFNLVIWALNPLRAVVNSASTWWMNFSVPSTLLAVLTSICMS